MGFAREALAQLVAEYDRVGDRRVRRRGRQPLRGARWPPRTKSRRHGPARAEEPARLSPAGFPTQPSKANHGLWAGGVPIPPAGVQGL